MFTVSDKMDFIDLTAEETGPIDLTMDPDEEVIIIQQVDLSNSDTDSGSETETESEYEEEELFEDDIPQTEVLLENEWTPMVDRYLAGYTDEEPPIDCLTFQDQRRLMMFWDNLVMEFMK